MIEMISTLEINEDEMEIDFVVKEVHSWILTIQILFKFDRYTNRIYIRYNENIIKEKYDKESEISFIIERSCDWR